jgi:hypothetical protein
VSSCCFRPILQNSFGRNLFFVSTYIHKCMQPSSFFP